MCMKPFLKRALASLFLTFCLCTLLMETASAFESSTLYHGCQGDDVRELQQALIDLGFLKGTADGVFGNKTENAVRAFQRKYKLTVDGLAGVKTREMAVSKASAMRNPATSSPVPQITPAPSAPSASQPSSSSSGSSGSLFGDNYTTICSGSRGDRVKLLQQALISTGFLSGRADGIFGNQTLGAVIAFQSSMNLTADGLAGRKTLTALENAVGVVHASTPVAVPAASAPVPAPVFAGDGELNDRISEPSVSSVQLLHWFSDVKPSLSSGQKLLIYDPSSGLNWSLQILSRGRHCDAEPLTAKDTRTMVQAFGGVNTWNQKAVYVLLPDGRWTIGSTHDMPHESGSIRNNDFNGHLCVHFLRDMSEAQKNDPKYGVANQETIRSYWKKLTGEDITY